MEEKDLLEKMETLTIPETGELKHQRLYKEKILSAERSAALSIWFIVIPLYLVFCTVMEVFFNLRLNLFDLLDRFFGQLNNSVFGDITAPLIMLGFPTAGIIFNMLSVIELEHRTGGGKIKIKVKLKPVNIMIILLSILVLGLFIVYLILK